MGITALLSTLLGFVGGVVPEIMREVRDSRAASREMQFLEAQHTMQLERMKLEADAKVRDANANIVAEEVRAIREQVVAAIEAGSRPTGIAWIDGFNAILRPLAALLVLLLFIVAAFAFTRVVLGQYQAGQIKTVADLAAALWGSQIGFAVEAVFGFLFGARQVRKVL